jgi:hypothetical protein
MANEDISNGFKVINAFDIVDSEQNIDDTDHYKLITNPGMMFVTEIPITRKLKNPDQFEKLVSDAIDYSSSLDFEPSATKIGVFLNMSDDNLAVIDTNFTAIKKKLCGNTSIEEFFVHRQYKATDTEFVRIIASGMHLPKDELMDIYDKYQKGLNSNSKSDNFFDEISGMDTSISNSSKSKKDSSSGSDFFSQFDTDETTAEDELVIRRSKKRRPVAFSGTPAASSENAPETGTYKKKKNPFVAQASNAKTFGEDESDTSGF